MMKITLLPIAAICLLSLGAPSAAGMEVSAEPREIARVPLHYVDGRILVPLTIDGVGERYFILDTAAGSSVISERLRDELGLSGDALRADTVHGATGSITMEFARLPGLNFAGTRHEGAWTVVIDTDLGSYDERPIEGLLGVDLLAGHDVTIDIPAGELRLDAAGPDSPVDQAGEGLAFHSGVQEGFVLFQASLSGKPVNAVLDTGARVGTLNWEAARLSGVGETDEVLVTSQSRGIDGGALEGHRGRFEDLCLASHCPSGLELKIADLAVFEILDIADGPAMLVGAAFLETCPVTIAYSTNRLFVCE